MGRFVDSYFITRSRNESNIEFLHWLDDHVCFPYLANQGSPFIYVYDTFFNKLEIKIPFIEFQQELLRITNVTPSKLHHNSWGFARDF